MFAKSQRPETNISFNTPDIQKMDLTKCSIKQIIHRIFGWKCILFINTLAVYFSCIRISQGSVTIQFTCGEIFNNHFIANCPQNAEVKKF